MRRAIKELAQRSGKRGGESAGATQSKAGEGKGGRRAEESGAGERGPEAEKRGSRAGLWDRS